MKERIEESAAPDEAAEPTDRADREADENDRQPEEGEELEQKADAEDSAEEDDSDSDGDGDGDGDGDSSRRKKGGRWPVDRLKPVVEALVFASGEPLSVRKICSIVKGASAAEVHAALEAIAKQCEEGGISLVEVAGGWQFRTAPQHHEHVRQLFKERPFRLTRAAIETLAIVAYRQPCTRAEVEAVRGVDSSGVLESLVERRIARIAGRRDVPGRPLVYVTTPLFLETFGLKDLKVLPTLSELGDDVRNMAERAEFESEDERDAAILPLEEGDSGREEEADGAGPAEASLDVEAVEQSAEEGDDQRIEEDGNQPAEESSGHEPGEEDSFESAAEEESDGDVPKISFRSHEEREDDDSEEEDDGDFDEEDDDEDEDVNGQSAT